jgi:hypothetical protein
MQKTDLSGFLAFQRNLKSALKHFIFLEFLCLLSFFKKRTEAEGELNFTSIEINTKKLKVGRQRQAQFYL